MPDFNEQLPDWTADGIEPPESKKSDGWQVNDHPPAGWLNWLFSRAHAALVEIRTVFSAHKADTTAHVTAAERTAWNAGATAASNAIPTSQKGAASGVATLDGTTKLPAGQLPISAVQATTADITYYVRTDGSDSNNGLANTSVGAFKTIGKAISMLPQTINHAVIINVAAGAYSEDLLAKGYNGSGTLEITASGVVSVPRILTQGNAIQVTITGFIATTTMANAIELTSNVWVWLQNCYATANAGSYYGVVVYGGTAVISGGTYSNKTTSIWARSGANVFVTGIGGSGSGIGYLATEGAKIGGQAGTLSATSYLSITQTGGFISLGDGVLNPWGDNTASQRSFCHASHATQQTLSASVWTKIVCGTEGADNLGEYNPSTGVFTAQRAGQYVVTVSVSFTNFQDGDEIKVGVGGASGGPFLAAPPQRVNGAGYSGICFTTTVGLSAGGQLAPYALSARAGTLTNPDGVYSFFNVERSG
ncbi:hypothetical protein PSTEL_00710 [Paenibacillus stellifer]|uniref:C1q domain-containing protein n=1 Tax=Paenibacillus stellifer TaxID=169760 RepID=A0A089LK00_9BACL|nr:hypothetical protein [Paenibacillus stellifer]AIQ61866.1 hypothetical protein PSTEL_00710 [Paenibacillus stellifer]